jgi:hypothetical protein
MRISSRFNRGRSWNPLGADGRWDPQTHTAQQGGLVLLRTKYQKGVKIRVVVSHGILQAGYDESDLPKLVHSCPRNFLRRIDDVVNALLRQEQENPGKCE